MILKIMGALLILSGCAGYGVMICTAYRREEEMLVQLLHTLDYMQCELQFRMTPLPELCVQTGACCKGKISQFWMNLSEELCLQTSADVSGCILVAKKSVGTLPPHVDKVLDILAQSLGQFDAQGQLQALESTRTHCRTELEAMRNGREDRLQSYQTLSICAGAALVILLV